MADPRNKSAARETRANASSDELERRHQAALAKLKALVNAQRAREAQTRRDQSGFDR